MTNKAETLERREDRARRNEELGLARNAMAESKISDLFNFVSTTYGGSISSNSGNFEKWPSVSYKGKLIQTRGSLNEIPSKFTAQRTLTFTFTDAGVTTTVDIKRQTWQGRKRIERGESEVETETDKTQLYEEANILAGAALLLVDKVIDPSKSSIVDAGKIFKTAGELTSF